MSFASHPPRLMALFQTVFMNSGGAAQRMAWFTASASDFGKLGSGSTTRTGERVSEGEGEGEGHAFGICCGDAVASFIALGNSRFMASRLSHRLFALLRARSEFSRATDSSRSIRL
jgi:hypothetical protein